jgi:hypothetical protein
MRLYVCYGLFPSPRPGGHPCRNAAMALRDAGHDPEIYRSFGLGMLPDVPFNQTPGRRKVKQLTGNSWVPLLFTDDGEVVQGSREIAEWARQNPA